MALRPQIQVMTRKPKNLSAETSPPDTASDRLKAHQMLPGERFFPTTGRAVERDKFSEIIRLLWLPKGLAKDEINAIIQRALDQFESIKPTDATESMLATQMIGTHAAAAECLRRAMLNEQNAVWFDLAMKHAQKLMTLYTKQLATLDKHRGKGQQKITIERVNVESGGQAIVGNVDAGAARLPSPAKHHALPQIDHAPDNVTARRPARRPRDSRERG